MVGFLKRFFGGSDVAQGRTPAAEATAYNGYIIQPEPVRSGEQWNIAGVIKAADENDPRQHHFIRADTYANEDEAVRFSIIKAKQIIDERKDKVLDAAN